MASSIHRPKKLVAEADPTDPPGYSAVAEDPGTGLADHLDVPAAVVEPPGDIHTHASVA